MEQDNKMTPGNLGIVLGPRCYGPAHWATVSPFLAGDYPQACMRVETLIAHFSLVFEEEPEEAPGGKVRLPLVKGMQGSGHDEARNLALSLWQD